MKDWWIGISRINGNEVLFFNNNEISAGLVLKSGSFKKNKFCLGPLALFSHDYHKVGEAKKSNKKEVDSTQQRLLEPSTPIFEVVEPQEGSNFYWSERRSGWTVAPEMQAGNYGLNASNQSVTISYSPTQNFYEWWRPFEVDH